MRIGGESLGEPYLVEPSIGPDGGVARVGHDVSCCFAAPGGDSLGVDDCLRSSQLNDPCLIGERSKLRGQPSNGWVRSCPGKTINSSYTYVGRYLFSWCWGVFWVRYLCLLLG